MLSCCFTAKTDFKITTARYQFTMMQKIPIFIIIYLTVSVNFVQNQKIDAKSQQYLPACTNITLQAVSIEFEPLTFDNSTTRFHPDSTRHENFTLCYPLSPQLLSCPVVTLIDYIIDLNLTLRTADGLVASLGDYYIDPHGKVTICSEPIQRMNGIPDCNYLTIRAEDIKLMDDGSWRLNATGDVIYRPEILAAAIDNNSFNVCWPLTIPFINCPTKWVLEAHDFEIGSDHRLLFSLGNKKLGLGEYFRTEDQAIICQVEADPDSNPDTLYLGFYSLSVIFLLFTVIYLLMIPQHKYHNRCQLCHVISTCVMFLTLAIGYHVSEISPPFCYVLYVVDHISSLASLFWLNVLAFDAWQHGSQATRFRLRIPLCINYRFACYSVYAWGLPVLFCILCVVVDQNRTFQKALDIYPEIASLCWINERHALWAFYYGPLVTLMSFNVFYFIFTAFNFRFTNRTDKEIIRKNRSKKLFVVCFKLFLVTVLMDPFVADLLTWCFARHDYSYYWYVANTLTSLQGVAIFIVYIAKKKNFDNLRRKCCPNSTQRSFSAFPEFSKPRLSYSNNSSSDISEVSSTDISPHGSFDKENYFIDADKQKAEIEADFQLYKHIL